MRLLFNYTKSTEIFLSKLILLKVNGKLQNSGQLKNNTVNSAMLITINRMIKIVTSNSIKLLIQKRCSKICERFQ